MQAITGALQTLLLRLQLFLVLAVLDHPNLSRRQDVIVPNEASTQRV